MASRILAALDGPAKLEPARTPANPAAGVPFAVHPKRKRESEPRTPGPSSKRHASGRTPDGSIKLPPSQLLSNVESPNATIRPPSPLSSPLDFDRPMPRATRPGLGFGMALPQATQSALAMIHDSGPGSFALNYDRESRVTRLDIGGEDQEQRIAEFVSRKLDSLADKMMVKEALDYLGLQHIKDILPGMEVHLLPHQAIGVAWMLMQERNDHQKVFPTFKKIDPPYNGGILADEMGLGKTVQMIATMAMNLPAMEERVRTTLIVVPAALLHQWKEEIETKTNDLFTVHIHHTKDKLKTVEALQSKDIIITSYQTLNLDFGAPDDDMDEREWLRWVQKYGGVLSQMKWYRVVLDEAHFIRNRATRSSKTVAMLRTKYRWMLTGTPVTNSLADIYGLIRFGRFRPWNDWPSFEDHVASVQLEDAPLAGERARTILKPLLLRRRKDAQLEGKPLLELEPKHIDIVNAEFSEEERQIYDNFERQAKLTINRFIRQGTIVKNSAAVFVMILRLRQLCCHPNLILSQTAEGDDYTAQVKTEAERDLARALRLKGVAWVNQIKRRFLGRARAAQLEWAEEPDDAEMLCPVCKDAFMGNNGRVIACGHEVCQDCITTIVTSPIAHNGVFGEGDDKQNMKREQVIEDAQAKGHRPCPVCGAMADLGNTANVFVSAAFEPSEEELLAEARRAKGGGRFGSGLGLGSSNGGRVKAEVKEERKPARSILDVDLTLSDSDDDMPDVSEIIAKDKARRAVKEEKVKDEDRMGFSFGDVSRTLSDDSDVDDAPSQDRSKGTAKDKEIDSRTLATWRRGDGDMEPSAKMLELIRLLKEAERAGDKTIVYSQWTSMLDLIENLFTRYGIQNLRYDGKMQRQARDRALADFRKLGSPQRVILISTKCGGVGLNLVSANRVVNMDLCWNYAAESQAYDRVHRLGQEKEVFVSRLVVPNTIEERMLRLQDVKVGLADAALGEGTGGRLHKMSVKEIKLLFGMGEQKKPAQTQARDRNDMAQQPLPASFGTQTGAIEGMFV